MTLCSVCIYPDTRPDTHFVDGVCSACLSYDKRKAIDWAARETELLRIIEIAYLSGAKDSLEPLEECIKSDLPPGFESIFGAFSSRN